MQLREDGNNDVDLITCAARELVTFIYALQYTYMTRWFSRGMAKRQFFTIKGDCPRLRWQPYADRFGAENRNLNNFWPRVRRRRGARACVVIPVCCSDIKPRFSG